MKKFIQISGLLFLFGCGPAESQLENPVTIDGVEINSDSVQDKTTGKYKIYLKSCCGSSPYFCSNIRYSSGESLIQMSHLDPMINKQVFPLMDSIAVRDEKIKKLEKEKFLLEEELQEKTLFIKYLTKK